MSREAEKQFFIESMTSIANYGDLNVGIRTYSGRAMYGKKCLAITGDATDCQKFISEAINHRIQEMWDKVVDLNDDSDEAEWAEANDEKDALMDFVTNIGRARQDSMGLDVVIYWPNIECTDDDLYENGLEEEESEDVDE